MVKGEELSKTTDTLIRGMLLAELTARLGEVKALDLQAKTATIFEESRKVVEPIANARGITITSFLPAGGIHFLNEEIQGLIDQRFASERGESNAKLEQAAIEQQNLQMVEKAQAEAVRAEALLASRGAVMARLVREAKKAYAEASSSFYEKWDGKLPADIAPLELLRSFGFNANSSTGSPSDEDVLRLLGIDPETFGMPNEPIKQAPAVPNGSVKPAEASPSQPAAPTEPKKPSDSEQGK